MAAKRIDHSYETYGSVYVVGPHPLNHRHWEIRWSCCARTQEVSSERLAAIIRTVPTRCINCVQERAKENAYYAAKALRDQELRAAKKAIENRPGESKVLTIKDRLGFYWFELGKLGPRWS